MAMDGSDSHGDGDALVEYQYHFGFNFKEYVLKEQLKWSLYKPNFYDMWVFWSEQDHEIEPSLSLVNCTDFNINVCAIPKVRDNIRRALQKLMQSQRFLFYGCLFQFWAATKTLEGRTLLTTRYQPFALGGALGPSETVPLCNYRMEMCRKYNCFYADAESGEEQLGLPGRVFRNQFTESIPKVEYYTTKEYPQRDLALRCKIKGSWDVPVFEHSSQTCVGVLEMVSLHHSYSYGLDKNFLDNVNKIFQELGLQCFNGYPACEEESREKGLAQAFEELKMVLSSVCKTHELPLAMTWVPCSACNGLRRCEVSSTDVEFCLHKDHYLDEFLKAGKRSHLRKGLVAGRACSSPNMLYCSDISQLSLYDYPLVPYARLCKLSGWFTIYLQNVYTGNDIYVLEFFLSAINKNNENIVATLSYILGTMEEKFKTFRFASGKVLGELTSVEVIYFQNGQKIHSDERIQATRDFSLSSIPSSVQSSASVANKRPSFQDANMVKIHSVERIQATGDFSLSCIPSSVQSSASVANKRPSIQDANVVKIHSVERIQATGDFSLSCIPSSVQSSSSVSLSCIPSSVQSSSSVANKRPSIQDANVVKIHSVERIQATGDFSLSSIPSSVQSSTSVANKRPRFQDANMVTSKAKYDPNSNQFSNFDLSFDSEPSFELSSTSVANTRPGFQNANMVIIIAEYASIEEVFKLSLPCRLVELQQEVTKRLMLEAGNYSVTYEDEEDGPVLINCDEDLQTYVDDSMSQGDTPRVVLLELKEPATNLNPTN